MLLNWHPAVLVGLERFATLVNRAPGDLTPGLFELERFRSIERGDCGYERFEAQQEWSDWYARPGKLDELANCVVRGDKAPHLFRHLELFEADGWRDENVTIYHLVRDPEEVALSYQARLEDPNDAWQSDRNEAVKDWTHSVLNVARQFSYRRSNFRLRVICYEAVFDRGFDGMLDAARRMFTDLGVDAEGLPVEGIRKLYANGEQRRGRRLTDEGLADELARLVPPEAFLQYERLKDLAFLL